jgi:hypothetical protein
MIERFDDVVQGTEDWKLLRLGLPTASNFATILADAKDGEASKTRRKLLYRLAGERLTGAPAEEYSNKYTDRGNRMEAAARDYYAFIRNVEVTQTGFIRNTIKGTNVIVGYSPDGLIGKKKALEIKTMAPDLLIAQLLKGDIMPPEHRAQVQGGIMVGELDEIDLMLFYRGMPKAPIFPVKRDPVFIKELSNSIEIFDHELRRLVEKIKAMGNG